MGTNGEKLRKRKFLEEYFEVGNILGEGTFGFVYQVCVKGDPQRRKLALKCFVRLMNPRSICNELSVLKKLGGSHNVIEFKHAWRVPNQPDIFILMEYFPHESFYETIQSSTPEDIEDYMRNLLIALSYLHKNRIVHRDVKPANFLVNRKTKQYRLIDFGLSIAIKEEPMQSLLSATESHTAKRKLFELQSQSLGVVGPSTSDAAILSAGGENQMENSSKQVVAKAKNERKVKIGGRCSCVGYAKVCRLCRNNSNDFGNNAGTSGYRAPEILFRFNKLGYPVDLWASGVVLMCLLSGRYPFLRPPQDVARSDCIALAEIATLRGSARMQRAAEKLGKHWVSSTVCKGLELHLLALAFRKAAADAKTSVGDASRNSESPKQKSGTLPVEYPNMQCESCGPFVKSNVGGIGCLCEGNSRNTDAFGWLEFRKATEKIIL